MLSRTLRKLLARRIGFAAQAVLRGITTTIRKWAPRRQTAAEEKIDEVDRIGDVQSPRIVDVGALLTTRDTSSGRKEVLENENRIAQVPRTVTVRVPPAEGHALALVGNSIQVEVLADSRSRPAKEQNKCIVKRFNRGQIGMGVAMEALNRERLET